MYIVSNIGGYFRDVTFPTKYPNSDWLIDTSKYNTVPVNYQEQINQLRKDIEALKELIIAGKKYDETVGEPDCEHEDKVALIKQLAKLVGVSMEGVL